MWSFDLREADVASQSADTIKLILVSGLIGQYPIATTQKRRPQLELRQLGGRCARAT
jgi:hypothetical protein